MKWKFTIEDKLNRFAFILLTIIWLQIASILSKSFTGLLLNTYFNVKSVPIAQTLLDIHNDKNLLIATLADYFKLFSEDIDLPLEIKNNIHERIAEFQSGYYFTKFFQIYDKYFVAKLIRGQLAVICDTVIRDSLTNKLKSYENSIHVSKNKYRPRYWSFLIHRENKLADNFKFM